MLRRCAPLLALPLIAAAPVLPVQESFPDPAGAYLVDIPSGPFTTASLPFFQKLGTNARTCQYCHTPDEGFGLSATGVQARFLANSGTGALFLPLDGAVCPTASTGTVSQRMSAFGLLLNYGLIRIFEPVPPAPQFRVVSVSDPYGCVTNPEYGLTAYGPKVVPAGQFNVYRRPLPTTNLRFLSSIMADGREPSLASQASDAALIHEQAATAPTAAQVAQIVNFETGVFAAQSVGIAAGPLTALGGNGGPVPLVSQPFYPGINDPFGGNPTGAPFTPVAMTAYLHWGPPVPAAGLTAAQAAIGRGEALFNQKTFAVSGVAGLNDVLDAPSITATCSTCHDTPNAGSHSLPRLMDIGVTGKAPPALDVSGLPVYRLECVAGPHSGASYAVTDPGRALVTGQCADIGKIKVQTLRNLSARAPYFHNGSAAGLADVVRFYEARFNIGLTGQQQADLVAFLGSL